MCRIRSLGSKARGDKRGAAAGEPEPFVEWSCRRLVSVCLLFFCVSVCVCFRVVFVHLFSG